MFKEVESIMTKILYDYQIACAQKYGGVSRYHYELMNQLNQRDDCQADISVLFNTNYYFSKILGKHPIESYHGMWKPLAAINRCNTILKLAFHQYDIFHPTWYAYYLPGKRKEKLVITIHDMIQELLMENQEIIVKKKKKYIYKADHVIAISENTKRDILKLYPDIPENKISVVYHGTNHLPAPQKPKGINNLVQYVLFVGGRKSYKNAEYMLRDISDELIKRSIKVIFAGGGKFDDEEMELITTLGIKDATVQMNVSDEELAWLYQNALCFIYPSLYEGFGFPILEAFDNACPVLCSHSSSLPEVGGTAVRYFNAEEHGSLLNVFREVIDSDQLRAELIVRGTERVKEFTWMKTSERMLDIYQHVMRGDG